MALHTVGRCSEASKPLCRSLVLITVRHLDCMCADLSEVMEYAPKSLLIWVPDDAENRCPAPGSLLALAGGVLDAGTHTLCKCIKKVQTHTANMQSGALMDVVRTRSDWCDRLDTTPPQVQA